VSSSFGKIHKSNISYLNSNSRSVKNNNKLSRFLSFSLYDDKSPYNNHTQRSQSKIIKNIDIKNKKNDLNKKIFKSYNYKKRRKPLNNYKGLNTEINNFYKIIYFDANKDKNKNEMQSKRKTYSKAYNEELIKKRNMKNKIKSDIYDEYNNENSDIISDKIIQKDIETENNSVNKNDEESIQTNNEDIKYEAKNYYTNEQIFKLITY